MRPTRRAVILLLVTIAAFAAYFLVDDVVAYTSDAYVESDVIAIAPQVSGPIATLAITDNEQVKAGQVLATIDPTPFQLEVDLQTTVVAEAQAEIAALQDDRMSAQSEIDSANAARQLAQDNFDRINRLKGEGFAPVAELDTVQTQLRQATAAVTTATDKLDETTRAIAVQQARVATEKARLAHAQYNLDRTTITAPTDGYVNLLRLRVGDFATASQPIIGIVDATAWRVMANYRQHVAASLEPGQKVWVWLDAHPGRFHRGTIEGIARAVARDPGAPELLPYVTPTTDWIRLARRFPVTITLDDLPPDIRLHMGADARVFIVR